MTRWTTRLVCGGTVGCLALLLLTAAGSEKKAPAADGPGKQGLEFFRKLVGSWEGTCEGRCGRGDITMEFRPILQDRYLLGTTKAVFAPQERNPKGETHEEWLIASYDGQRDKTILREFHGEGYVNQYVLDSVSPDGRSAVFTTEHIENTLAPEFRMRLRYTLTSDQRLESQCEMQHAGREFEDFIHVSMKRARPGPL